MAIKASVDLLQDHQLLKEIHFHSQLVPLEVQITRDSQHMLLTLLIQLLSKSKREDMT